MALVSKEIEILFFFSEWVSLVSIKISEIFQNFKSFLYFPKKIVGVLGLTDTLSRRIFFDSYCIDGWALLKVLEEQFLDVNVHNEHVLIERPVPSIYTAPHETFRRQKI